MPRGGVCPVCEMPHDPDAARSSIESGGHAEPEDASAIGRWWRSGRLAIAVASACFLTGTFLPLIYVQHRLGLLPRLSASPLDMISAAGPYGRELRSMVVFVIPATAAGLASFLLSRRHGSVMVATRPLVFVVALLPLIGAVLPVLKIAKHHRLNYSVGPGLVFVLVGVAAGLLGALTFGRGVPDPRPRDRDDDDD